MKQIYFKIWWYVLFQRAKKKNLINIENKKIDFNFQQKTFHKKKI